MNGIKIELGKVWNEEQIVALYKAGGWWREYMDPSRLGDLVKGSFLFAVAIDISNGQAVGMGRVISDGMTDAYIQDVIVLPGWKGKGVGKLILSSLLEGCQSRGVSWIGLIAEPGTDAFYSSIGFERMEGHIPMLFHG